MFKWITVSLQCFQENSYTELLDSTRPRPNGGVGGVLAVIVMVRYPPELKDFTHNLYVSQNKQLNCLVFPHVWNVCETLLVELTLW